MILLRTICVIGALLSSEFSVSAAEERLPISAKITQKGKNQTTIFSRGTQRVMLRIESSTQGDGAYDRLIEAFYLNGKQVFTYSHFKPSPPGRMYSTDQSAFIFSGSMGINDPTEILLIGNPLVELHEGFILEGGKHRPMTAEELDRLRGQVAEFFPKEAPAK